MRNIPWAILAFFLKRPAVVDWLIRRAQRTPYVHITSKDGQDMYMGRWWLFNPYTRGTGGDRHPARWRWLPSIRLHHIMRPDSDRHLHDHPWNARTIVLRGWYREERPIADEAECIADTLASLSLQPHQVGNAYARESFNRQPGYTGRLLFGQYHRISQVSIDGVWTLFFTWGKQGTWGFNVDGKKVPYREYLGIND